MGESMNKLILPLMASALTLLGSGCAKDPTDRSQDPLKAYPNLRTDVPPTQTKRTSQDYASQLFEIKPLFQGEQSALQGVTFFDFREGQPSEYLLDIRFTEANVFYDLKLTDETLAQFTGMKLEHSKANPSRFVLKWTPQRGYLAAGQSQVELPMQVQVEINPRSNPYVLEGLKRNNVNLIKTFGIRVAHVGQKPIAQVKGLKIDEITLDSTSTRNISFQIEVEDPAMTHGMLPELILTYDPTVFSNELRFVDLTPAIESINRTDNGKKRVFHYEINLSKLNEAKIPGISKATGGEFMYMAVSRTTGQISPPSRKIFHFKRAETQGAKK